MSLLKPEYTPPTIYMLDISSLKFSYKNYNNIMQFSETWAINELEETFGCHVVKIRSDQIPKLSDDDFLLIGIPFLQWLESEIITIGDGFYEKFDENTKHAVHRPRTILIMDSPFEGYTVEFFDVFYPYLYNTAGLIGANIYYATSSLNVREENEKYCKERGYVHPCKVIQAYYWERIDLYYDNKGFSFFKPSKYKNRPKKFLNLNRRIRPDRTAFACLLSERDLIKHGHVSFFNSDDWVDSHVSGVHETVLWSSPEICERILSGLLSLMPQLPLLLDKDDGAINYAIDTGSHWMYQESYFSLVSCTYFNNKFTTIQMNEKVFKPIAYKQPFILVGLPNTLAKLQEYGFKTFSPFINEKYDTLVDPGERAMAIMDEVERLCNLSNREWDTIIAEMESILEYNFNRLFHNHALSVGKSHIYELLDELGVNHYE